MMTEQVCINCGTTIKLDMDAARKEHKETFGSEVKQEVILCRPCYDRIMNAALEMAKTDKEN